MDFLSAPAEEKTRAAYVDTLIREIEDFEEPEDYEVVTVFFGGGTPSILPGEAILRLMKPSGKSFTSGKRQKSRWKPIPELWMKKSFPFIKRPELTA